MRHRERLNRWRRDPRLCFEEEFHGYWDREYDGGLCWTAIADEGRTLWNETFGAVGGYAQKNSALDHFIHGIAAEAAHGAFTAVARAVGLDVREVEAACEQFYTYSNYTDFPKPIGWRKFKAAALKRRKLAQRP